ncbi:hypothetical protein LINPERHAP2_LOCUS10565 [Linum perenne]
MQICNPSRTTSKNRSVERFPYLPNRRTQDSAAAPPCRRTLNGSLVDDEGPSRERWSCAACTESGRNHPRRLRLSSSSAARRSRFGGMAAAAAASAAWREEERPIFPRHGGLLCRRCGLRSGTDRRSGNRVKGRCRRLRRRRLIG